MNNKQAWFCTCLYKLVHSSFGTSKTPAYPFEAKTVSFMFWLSFPWQFCKSNRFCLLPSLPPSPPPCSNFNTPLSSVIEKWVELSYGNYPITREDTELYDMAEGNKDAAFLMKELWQTNCLRWMGDTVYLCLGQEIFFPFLLPFLWVLACLVSLRFIFSALLRYKWHNIVEVWGV